MNGIELSRAFYEQFGKAMLREKFPHLKDKIAVGIAGSGSDCYGYDDDISRDHDYEAGFCIFLPGEDVVSRRDEFLLERAYNALPSEFMSVKRPQLSPVGGNRRGVIRYADFFERFTGDKEGRLSDLQLLSLPENYLFEATDGEVFYDGYGRFSEIRSRLRTLPEDVRTKKIAGNVLIMNQSGQYNYFRCVRRGDEGACQLALTEFVKAAMSVVFLLNGEYKPYYKWCFYALRRLKSMSETADMFEKLLTADNKGENVEKKEKILSGVADIIAGAVSKRYDVNGDGDLEKLAYAVNNKIKSEKLRNLNIFAGV